MPKQTVDDLKELNDPQKVEDQPEIAEESTWSRDQRERSYYYDDATGYQKYDPEEDDDEEDETGEIEN